MQYSMLSFKKCSNHSSLGALGNSSGDEAEDEPVCSTGDYSLEEKGSSGGFDVALG